MRVAFSTSDPLRTLHDLKYNISYRTFIDYLEMLDAKTTIEEDARIKEINKAKQAEGKKK